MKHRTSRPRRTASRRQIQVLRVLGWRYSAPRDAWVHRIGHGRRGPVFSTHQAQELTALAGPDEHLAAAIVDVDRRRDRGAPLAAESTASSPPAPEAAHATAPAPGTAEEATAPPTPAETPPPLARRIPRRASLPTPSVPTTSSHEVEVDLGGDTVTVRVDGRPPAAPGRPRLAIAPTEATA